MQLKNHNKKLKNTFKSLCQLMGRKDDIVTISSEMVQSLEVVFSYLNTMFIVFLSYLDTSY